MFENIGKKIKTLANVLCWLGIIVSIITARIMFIMAEAASYDTDGLYIGLGFSFLFLAPLFSWINSFFIYGFGELIDKICDIERNMRSDGRKSNTQVEIELERVEKLERLRSQSLITEEEYQQALAKDNK